MKIDYIQLLKDSVQFTWKYKILWVFGLILTLFSGGSSGGGTNYSTDSSTSGSSQQFDNLERTVNDFVSSPYFWLIVGLFFLLILFLIIISWYLTSVSKTALINAYLSDQSGDSEDIKIFKLWKGAHPFLLRILGLDLLLFASIIPLIIVFIPLIIFPPLLCCLGIPLIIAFAIIISALKLISLRFIVIEGKGVIESLKESWILFQTNFSKFFIAWLVQLIPTLIYFVVLIVMAMIVFIPLTVILFATFTSPDTAWIGISIAVCSGLVFVVLLALLGAPLKVLTETYWTKFILMLLGKE